MPRSKKSEHAKTNLKVTLMARAELNRKKKDFRRLTGKRHTQSETIIRLAEIADM